MKTPKTLTDSVHQHATHDVACVLYSPDNGKIVFTHRFTVLGDAPHPSQEEIEKHARASLQDHGNHVAAPHAASEKLKALIVSGEELRPGHTFSVDPKNGTLLAHPRRAAEK